jgi:hypothetical protein
MTTRTQRIVSATALLVLGSLGGLASVAHANVNAPRDPYTDGARVDSPRDPYTDGARVDSPRDPYTQGARFDQPATASATQQLAGRDLTGVSESPEKSDA